MPVMRGQFSLGFELPRKLGSSIGESDEDEVNEYDDLKCSSAAIEKQQIGCSAPHTMHSQLLVHEPRALGSTHESIPKHSTTSGIMVGVLVTMKRNASARIRVRIRLKMRRLDVAGAIGDRRSAPPLPEQPPQGR